MILPFLCPINQYTNQFRFNKYLLSLCMASFLSLAGQLIFQIVLLSSPPYGNQSILPNCSFKQEILEEFGYSRFDKASIVDIMRLIIPDFLLFSVSLAAFLICRKVNIQNKFIIKALLNKSPNPKLKRDGKDYLKDVASSDYLHALNKSELKDSVLPEESADEATVSKVSRSKANLSIKSSTSPNGVPFEEARDDQAMKMSSSKLNNKVQSGAKQIKSSKTSYYSSNYNRLPTNRFTTPIKRFFKTILPIALNLVFLLLLFACGALWPSALSFFYFLSFITLLTRWSLAINTLNSKFLRNLKKIIIVYLALHLLISYVYQIHYLQVLLPPEDDLAKLLGLNQIVYTRCESPAHLFLNTNLRWQQYANSFVLLVLYYYLSIEYSYTLGSGIIKQEMLPEALETKKKREKPQFGINSSSNKLDMSPSLALVKVRDDDEQKDNVSEKATTSKGQVESDQEYVLDDQAAETQVNY